MKIEIGKNNPILRKKSQPIKKIDEKIKILAKDIMKTFHFPIDKVGFILQLGYFRASNKDQEKIMTEGNLNIPYDEVIEIEEI